jgi:hypothetical protein
MKCNYCGIDNEPTAKKCKGCGSKMEDSVPKMYRSEPFYFNGYIVYVLRDFLRLQIDFQFWKGVTIIGRVEYGEDEYHRLYPADGVDHMDDIFKVFRNKVDPHTKIFVNL